VRDHARREVGDLEALQALRMALVISLVSVRPKTICDWARNSAKTGRLRGSGGVCDTRLRNATVRGPTGLARRQQSSHGTH
jgi:hypothetical protein